MNSQPWYPAYQWSESLKIYEILAIFQFEQHAREWEEGLAYYAGIPANTANPELRDSRWAKQLFG